MKLLWSYFVRAMQVTWVCLRNLAEAAYAHLRKRPGIPGPERLRLLLEELGGSFLKFGQILSLQVDTLPKEYCDTLRSLLDRVPPTSREQVRQVFHEELGKPPESVYREFDYQPMASASIGQVHRATLADSTPVAIKVQRPGVRELFLRDAVLLRLFVRIIFFFRIQTLYFMRDPVREFNEWVLDELDYRREASYAEALGRNARETPTEAIPRIHWNLTTSRVLTMDFLEGYSVMDYLRMVQDKDRQRVAELEALGFDPSQFVSNVIHNFLSDAFRFGIFHADLHPANLLIMKNNVVGYVDFGIVGNMTPEARRKQIQLSMAYARGKSEEIFAAFLNVCSFHKDVDLTGFRRELERRTRLWYREPAIGGVPHLKCSLTIAMFDLLGICRDYGLLVDREMIKYIRSLILVDGLVSLLAPGLDLAPTIRKVCEEFLARDAQNRLLSRGAALTLLVDLSGWLSAGPGRLLHALERMEKSLPGRRGPETGETDRREGLRVRALAVAAVWVSTAMVVWTAREGFSPASLSFAAYLVIAFWGAGTIWLVTLLRRLAKP